MTYKRFEDTPVWQAAHDLGMALFALLEDRAFDRKGDLRDQLQRAVLSISNNIAEGFERASTDELIRFLYIARGSAGEVRSMLRFAVALCEQGVLRSQISDLKSQISSLIPRVESVSRQIRGWTETLQNSPIKGQRHLNDSTRAEADQLRRTHDFMDQLNRIRSARQKENVQ
jgi:four helix bundle protein